MLKEPKCSFCGRRADDVWPTRLLARDAKTKRFACSTCWWAHMERVLEPFAQRATVLRV